MIKPRQMFQTGNAVFLTEMRKAHKISVGKSEGKRPRRIL
jgi:hypothetical protein